MGQVTIDITLPRRAFDVRARLSLDQDTVVLVGPSGAGKTSLLRAVAGLERACAGRIGVGEQVWLDTTSGLDRPAERRHVGYLPQDYALFPHLTVAGNVSFAGRRERPDLLERLGIAHLARARPGELSGGERQRVGLARALAREPLLLLLDEPFAALDAVTRERVRDELASILRAVRLPTLLVTHLLADAAVLGDRVGVIERGALLQLDTPERVLRRPASAAVAALVGANVLCGMAGADAGGAIVELDGGGRIPLAVPATGPVELAVAPWAFSLVPLAEAMLTDVVLRAHREGGVLVVRLSRLTIHVPVASPQAGTVTEGARLGIGVAPREVHLIGGRAPAGL
jgi:molybdate transport system ATP-binding protein